MFIFNINFTLTQFSPFPHFCCNILTPSPAHNRKPHNMFFMLISIKYYSDPASLFFFFNICFQEDQQINGEGLGMRISIQYFCTLRTQPSQIPDLTMQSEATKQHRPAKRFKETQTTAVTLILILRINCFNMFCWITEERRLSGVRVSNVWLCFVL